MTTMERKTDSTADDYNFAMALYKQLNGEDFNVPEEPPPFTLLPEEDNVCENDAALAADLQEQFDRNYDDELRRMERAHNSKNTVGISYSNYYRSNQKLDCDDGREKEEPVDPSEQQDWDNFDEVNREYNSIPACGYKVKNDGTILTKHDAKMSGRRNACKLLNLPPHYDTGDTASSGVVISNKPFNSLIRHSKREEHRRMKINDKKQRSTANHVIDQYTRQEIYKLISNEVLKSLGGTIQIGKEASVFYAEGNQHCPNLTVPKNCCVKIYKSKLHDSKQRDQLKEDRRFKDRLGGQSSRKAVNLWAEKEMSNLLRLQRENIPCPAVVTLKKHLLVMSLIGDSLSEAAPRLKHAEIDEEELESAYKQVIKIMKDMYSKASLIHADLSEYNILWYKKQCYIIDVSQSIEPSQKNSFQLLMRDCYNICNFFEKKGVCQVINPEELFKEITGTDYHDKEALASLREVIKAKPHHANMNNPPLQEDTFEDTWERLHMPTKNTSSSEDEEEAVEEEEKEEVKNENHE